VFAFLDRDGTIIEERNHLRRIEDLAFIPGSEAAIARLNQAGIRVVVISNQSGVGRGYFTEEFVRETHRFMQAHLEKHNARIEAFYFCPHLPSDNCDCRKPRTGMLERAARDFGSELRGVVVGDKPSDLEAGHNARLDAVLVQTGYGRQTLAEGKTKPDFVARDLSEAAARIVKKYTAKYNLET